MTDVDDVLAIVVRVARALERAGVKYAVGGSIASSLYGEPRATRDIDVAVLLREADIPRFLTELGPDFAVDEAMVLEAVRTHRSANIFFLPSFMKIDLFVRGDDSYDRLEFARGTVVEPIAGEPITASSAEDNLLWKLRWFRKGGEVSDQQWRDVLGILRASGGQLDHEYLRTWSTAHEVRDLLNRALVQSAL